MKTSSTWDAAYTNHLYKSTTTLHTDVQITTPYTLLSTDSVAPATVLSESGSATFLYPLVPEEKYAIDGVADGNITLVSNNHGGVFADLDEIVITLQKITEEDVSDDLASYTLGGRVVAGGAGVIVDGATEGEAWQYAFPFWLEISAQEVSSDERLRLKVEVWGRSGADGEGITSTFSLVLTVNTDDLYVNLPLV